MSLHVLCRSPSDVGVLAATKAARSGSSLRPTPCVHTLCSHLSSVHTLSARSGSIFPFLAPSHTACVHTSPPCTPCPHTPGHTIVVAAATAVEATEEVEAAPANQRRLSRGYADHTLTVAAAKAAEAVEEVREV